MEVRNTDLTDGRVRKGLCTRSYDRPDSSGSSACLGDDEDTGVDAGTSAGNASSGEGVSLSDASPSEVFGEGACEDFVSSGDALDGEGTSGRVELEASGKTFWNSC